MAEKIDELSKNLKQSSTWYRIFTMVVLSLLICLAVVPLIIVLALSQTALTLISGSNNQNLRYFGMEMTDYVNQVLRYITFNSDKKPYPFSSQSDKAKLGANIMTNSATQARVSKRAEKRAKKKLYEIETSGVDTTEDEAKQDTVEDRTEKSAPIANVSERDSIAPEPEARAQSRPYEDSNISGELGQVDKTVSGHR